LLACAAALLLGGCVYRVDIQQGNLVEPENLEKVDVGMTRSQVEFLLGTPMVADSFHQDRWDYPYYYLTRGRERQVEKSWFVVYFKDDHVVRIERNLGEPAAVESADKSKKKEKEAEPPQA
jgi:outer membrane protein assembly factor BamE